MFRKVAARNLSRGDIVRFGDGVELEVESAAWGPGLIYNGKKTARVVDVSFVNGHKVKAHPAESVLTKNSQIR